MSASDPVYRKDVQTSVPESDADGPPILGVAEPNWRQEYLALRRRIGRVYYTAFIDETAFQLYRDRLHDYLLYARKSAAHPIAYQMLEHGAISFTDFTTSKDPDRPYARQMTAEVRVIMPGSMGKLSFERELETVALQNQKIGFQKARNLVRERSSWSSLSDVNYALAAFDVERSM